MPIKSICCLGAGYVGGPTMAMIAASAAALPSSFPRDPMDRLIYATAIEHGVKLVTRDEAITEHDKPRSLVVW